MQSYYPKGMPVFRMSNQIHETYAGEDNLSAKHYVLWSGGCDSTLLLFELLQEYGSDNVVAVSYNYPWLDKIKHDSEVAYRNAFKAKMNLRGSRYANFKHIELEIGSTSDKGFAWPVSGGLPQAIAWLLSIPLYMNDGDYVYEGGIKEDDLTLFTDEYQSIVDNISTILGRKIKLRRPYLYYRKADIIDKLIRYDIYDCTWYCEMPRDVGTPCCHCVPCATHINALVYLTQMSNDSFVKEVVNRKIEYISELKNSTRIDTICEEASEKEIQRS